MKKRYLREAENSNDIYIYSGGVVPDDIKYTIKKVIIKEGVKEIEESAFEFCENIKSIQMAKTLTTIKEKAFSGCISLTEIIIPKSVTTIYPSAFSNCENLALIGFEKGINLKVIANFTFNGCKSLENITIPESVTRIGNYSFFNCTNLKQITLTKNIESLGKKAFANCDNLRIIYYIGDKKDWKNIDVDDDNKSLLKARIKYMNRIKENLKENINSKLTIKIPTIISSKRLVESINSLSNTNIKDYGWGYLIESTQSNKTKIKSILDNLGFDKEDYEVVKNTQKLTESVNERPIKEETSKEELIRNAFRNKDIIKESLDRIDFDTDNRYDLRMLYEATTYSNEEIEELETLLDDNADEETIHSFLMKKGIREPKEVNNSQLTNREEFDDLFVEVEGNNQEFKEELERRYKCLEEGRDVKIGTLNPKTFNKDVDKLLNEGYLVYQHPNKKKYNVIILKY